MQRFGIFVGPSVPSQDSVKTATPTIPAKRDVLAKHGPSKNITFETSEETWMSVDNLLHGRDFVGRKRFRTTCSPGAGAMWIYHVNGGAGIEFTDLLVLDEEPLDNIRNSTAIRWAMANWRLYDAMTMEPARR